jgi:tetratricopeptide (TPR) repeat protein
MAPSTVRTNVDPCPEAEVIAAYLDGRLTERERATVTQHLAECESCYFVFTEAAQMRASSLDVDRPEPLPDPVVWWKSRRVLWSSSAGLAAAAVLVIAIGVGLTSSRWSNRTSPELRALISAVGTDRTIEPRLTGGFAHGPLRGAFRGRDPVSPVVTPDVALAAAEIERRELGQRTFRSSRVLGLAYLVTGEIDRAVTSLESAVEQSGGTDAECLSDLAAAYLVRASRGDQSRQDLTKALAAADRAITNNSGLPEAAFNRAFALDRLALIDEAHDAWAEYLKLDDQSGWADEARAHLRTRR